MKLRKKIFLPVVFALLATASVVGAEEHVLEFEEFDGAEAFTTVALDSANGGTYLELSGQAELTKSFEIEESGYYDITYVTATDINTMLTGHGNYATLNQKIDDGEYAQLCAVYQVWIRNLKTLEDLSGSMGENWSKTKYEVPVYFEAGTHTISFKTSNKKANLDYVKIASADLVKVDDENSYVQFEDFSSDATESTDSATGIKAVHVEIATNAGISTYERSLVVYAENAGEYNLEIGASNQATSVYMSPMEISVNNGDAISIASGTFKIAEYDVAPFESVWQCKRFIYDGKVELKAGANIIKVLIKERNDGGLYGKLDYVRLSTPKSLDGLSITAAEDFVAIGDKFTFTLKNGSGQAVTVEDLKSYDIEVISVGRAVANTGFSLTAKNFGEAVFKITAENDLGSAVATGSFYVVGTDGLFVSDGAVSSGSVSFKLNAAESYAGGDTAIIAAYGFDGANPTSIKAMTTVELPALAEGESTTLSSSALNLSDADTVRIFLVKSRPSTRAIYGKTEISLNEN